MRTLPADPPRSFQVGLTQAVTMVDCGRVELEPDEQVTFVTPGGAEYDVARKSWGFYATPSLNHRLPRLGLRAALLRNRLGHLFVVLVERGHEEGFAAYAQAEQLRIERWLDEPAGGSP
jgi:hypothetical protein